MKSTDLPRFIANAEIERWSRWQTIAIDTSEIKSFDDAPATMLHVLMRKD